MMTVEELQTSWRDLNVQYFGGQLPAITISWSKRLTASAGMFRAKTLHCEPHDGGGSRLIRLSMPLLSGEPDSEVIGTLAHEMIHQWEHDILKKSAGHGPDFHRMMAVMNRNGMNITVRHGLQGVEAFLRYCWQCVGCGFVYRRQRRTITKQHRCGKCRSSLKQIGRIPATGKADPESVLDVN